MSILFFFFLFCRGSDPPDVLEARYVEEYGIKSKGIFKQLRENGVDLKHTNYLEAMDLNKKGMSLYEAFTNQKYKSTKEGNYLCFNFKDHFLIPSHLIIKPAKGEPFFKKIYVYGSDDSNNPLQALIGEISTEGSTFCDKTTKDGTLCNSNNWAIFEIPNKAKAYKCITIQGVTTSNGVNWAISDIDFFGVYSKDKRGLEPDVVEARVPSNGDEVPKGIFHKLRQFGVDLVNYECICVSTKSGIGGIDSYFSNNIIFSNIENDNHFIFDFKSHYLIPSHISIKSYPHAHFISEFQVLGSNETNFNSPVDLGTISTVGSTFCINPAEKDNHCESNSWATFEIPKKQSSFKYIKFLPTKYTGNYWALAGIEFFGVYSRDGRDLEPQKTPFATHQLTHDSDVTENRGLICFYYASFAMLLTVKYL